MAEREVDRRSFEWPLTRASLVVEIGGFKGRWASEIARRYKCRIHIFEPQIWAADKAADALRNTGAQWEIHHYGLVANDDAGELAMGAWETDACSILRDAAYMEAYVGSRNKTGTGQFSAALPALEALGDIDLLMMNIEGYEYRLLPELIEGGTLDRIRFLAVQFHEEFEGEGEYEAVCAAIAQTHDDLQWGFERTLRTWERHPA